MSIYISESGRVIDGLDSMLKFVLGPHSMVFKYVEVEIALYIVEIAKRMGDKEKWFPRGKWATIQAIQARIAEHMDELFHD